MNICPALEAEVLGVVGLLRWAARQRPSAPSLDEILGQRFHVDRQGQRLAVVEHGEPFVRIALINRDVPSYFQSLEHLLRYGARPPSRWSGYP